MARETKTRFAEISVITNPETGEVTLFISNETWGPVVTGKNLSEAKSKMREAFGLTMIANSFCATKNSQEEISEMNQEFKRINDTLEFAL